MVDRDRIGRILGSIFNPNHRKRKEGGQEEKESPPSQSLDPIQRQKTAHSLRTDIMFKMRYMRCSLLQ
jgi:hypothetical protein